MKFISLFMGLVFLGISSNFAATRTIDNPQSMMVGARQMSLGGTNPVLDGDIGGMMINPSVLGTVDLMPFSLTSQRLLNAFDYTLLSGSLPFNLTLPFVVDGQYMVQRLLFGLSYGSVGLGGIPETVLDGDVHRQIGTFSSGYQVFQGAVSTVFYDLFGFNMVSTGIAGKYISHDVKSARNSAIGLDAGIIGTYDLGAYMIDRLHLGVSALNIFSTPFEVDGGGKSFLPIEFYLGGRVDMLNDQLSLFVHNSFSGFSYGAEYLLSPGFSVRSSTDFERYNLGTGIVFSNVSGFGGQPYDMRLDYNMSINAEDIDSSHTISLTIMGGSQLSTPRIIKPIKDYLTSTRRTEISGLGPKNQLIQLYVNGAFVRSVMANRYGKWVAPDFGLLEGKNEIFAEATSVDKEHSEKSLPITITLDTTPPELDIAIFPEENEMVLLVLTAPDTVEVLGVLGGNAMPLAKVSEGTWEGRAPLPPEHKDKASVPAEFSYVDVAAKDEVGNESSESHVPYFVTMSFPPDKYVHEKESLRLIGSSSPMVKEIKVGTDRVYIDDNKRFSISRKLTMGKNSIPITYRTLNDEDHQYHVRVLRLASFTDLEGVKGKRAIELMATLGIVFGDKDEMFRPTAPVTRKYMARVMVKAAGLTVAPKAKTFFSDIAPNDPDAPYIEAAIENGLMVAYPDGSFRPDVSLTMGEAMSFLSSAGIAGEGEEENVKSGIVTRSELATALSYQPKYEEKISDLVNFEAGY